MSTIVKAKLTSKEKDSLPDSSFLYVESGGKKDADGKTTPRSLRHFPVKDANGKVDAAHVRNALARIPQAKLPQSVKDKASAKAKKLLNNINKAYTAEIAIAKSRMIIKPKNKAGNVVNGIAETGTASIDITRAGSLNDVRVKKPAKKDNQEYSNDTAESNDFPVQPGRSADTDDAPTNYCAYCGAKNPQPQPDDDAATGVILGGSKFDKNTSDERGTDLGVDTVSKMLDVRLTKSTAPEEEQYVLGVVLEPETEDSQKDIYSAEEIRKSAHMYMEKHMHIGLQHNGHVDDRVKILESYLAPCDFQLNDQQIKKGTWLLGARILDDELWGSVKKGDITGWSIGGSAVRTEVTS